MGRQVRGMGRGLLEEGQVAAVPYQQQWDRGLDWRVCVGVWVCVSGGAGGGGLLLLLVAKLTWPCCNRLERK